MDSCREVQQSMARLGLDQEDGLFDKIDADKSGAVSFDEFIEGVTLIMKGNEPAKGKDMVGTCARGTREFQRFRAKKTNRS